jgi:hypothetical protein
MGFRDHLEILDRRKTRRIGIINIELGMVSLFFFTYEARNFRFFSGRMLRSLLQRLQGYLSLVGHFF